IVEDFQIDFLHNSVSFMQNYLLQSYLKLRKILLIREKESEGKKNEPLSPFFLLFARKILPKCSQELRFAHLKIGYELVTELLPKIALFCLFLLWQS
ncbi:MAG: hypothetical protein LBM62_07170, partial [Mediterranea sp.]|nr:hypothetical protein [Mediterranea sp.]